MYAAIKLVQGTKNPWVLDFSPWLPHLIGYIGFYRQLVNVIVMMQPKSYDYPIDPILHLL